jgi:hypothetical protein
MIAFKYKQFTRSELGANKGVALLIAVMILTSSLAIALGIYSIYSGEILLSEDARESYKAFYSANTGIECIIYYTKYPPGGDIVDNYSFFLPPMWPEGDTTKTIQCGGQSVQVDLILPDDLSTTGERSFRFGMNNICVPNATLFLENSPFDMGKYRITVSAEGINFSLGVCGGAGARTQVQRGIKKTYQLTKPTVI